MCQSDTRSPLPKNQPPSQMVRTLFHAGTRFSGPPSVSTDMVFISLCSCADKQQSCRDGGLKAEGESYKVSPGNSFKVCPCSCREEIHPQCVCVCRPQSKIAPSMKVTQLFSSIPLVLSLYFSCISLTVSLSSSSLSSLYHSITLTFLTPLFTFHFPFFLYPSFYVFSSPLSLFPLCSLSLPFLHVKNETSTFYNNYK